ncbi:hypothetical protein N7468_004099 [Penicillium chermesinum]|uniref:hydroxyisourate hydrolase n=1 Tax=Penicillium chermesinum TaxID=63820 RepID=A0A9W9P7U6_9EURO|nr:uncharacterized protein N7468_004099 [Penicillium chermesinum]KAJ5239480.1 hypothetical protein N7468_004099 [Penicillium chermesinum]
MDTARRSSPDRTNERLALYQQQLAAPLPSSATHTPARQPPTMAARDPITCHVLNTLTGTPAANLPVTLTLLSAPASPSSPVTFHATTNGDGRVAKWTPTSAATTLSVPEILAALPTGDSKTNWAVRFEVGPWYEAQGIESFWPEVEVKFTVKGRGREGVEGWRHYHVPVLLGPWNYSTYRGS